MSTAESVAQTLIPAAREGLDQSFVEQSVAARFEQQVARYGDRLAVSDDRSSLTYDQLNRLANRIGHTIATAAQGTSGQVVICLEAGTQYIAAILGTLKAGHCYVPVDPAFPESRN